MLLGHSGILVPKQVRTLLWQYTKELLLKAATWTIQHYYSRPTNLVLCQCIIWGILRSISTAGCFHSKTLPLWWGGSWSFSGWWEKPWGPGSGRGQCVRVHPILSSQTLVLIFGQRADLMWNRHPVCQGPAQPSLVRLSNVMWGSGTLGIF